MLDMLTTTPGLRPLLDHLRDDIAGDERRTREVDADDGVPLLLVRTFTFPVSRSFFTRSPSRRTPALLMRPFSPPIASAPT
jgi:hypothetical protein